MRFFWSETGLKLIETTSPASDSRWPAGRPYLVAFRNLQREPDELMRPGLLETADLAPEVSDKSVEHACSYPSSYLKIF